MRASWVCLQCGKAVIEKIGMSMPWDETVYLENKRSVCPDCGWERPIEEE